MLINEEAYDTSRVHARWRRRATRMVLTVLALIAVSSPDGSTVYATDLARNRVLVLAVTQP